MAKRKKSEAQPVPDTAQALGAHGGAPTRLEEYGLILPSQAKNPNGLHRRYQTFKYDEEGKLLPPEPNALYFTLRLDDEGDDIHHIKACRAAMEEYAFHVRKTKPQLSDDVMEQLRVLREKMPLT